VKSEPVKETSDTFRSGGMGKIPKLVEDISVLGRKIK
jgi:hypothetical protein